MGYKHYMQIQVASSIFYASINLSSTNKRRSNKVILLKGVFIPKLLNNRLGFFSLINFQFLLSDTAYFDKTIILFFLSLQYLDFYFLVFFYTLNNTIKLFYNMLKVLINLWSFKFTDFFFHTIVFSIRKEHLLKENNWVQYMS